MSILIGGQSNHGKSMFLTNMILRLLENNPDVVVLDFTLDDPAQKRITQYVASLAHLDMNTVDYINKEVDPARIERFKSAVLKMKEWMVESNRLYIQEDILNDSSALNLRLISSIIEEHRAAYPDKKLVVAVDALNDIELTGIRSDDPFYRSETVAKELNKITLRNSCVLLATTHIRKNGGRRPSIEDVKGNNFLAYTAKVAIGIHNDMKQNGEMSQIFWKASSKEGREIKMPIIEAHFLKSKVSSFNGVICFQQWPSQARVQEAEASLQDILRGLILPLRARGK